MAKKHKINDAYDAWWFLYYHPKLQRRSRTPVEAVEARKLKRQGFIITKDRSGKFWREYRHNTVPAVVENLDIHYAKTDGKRVNDDGAKNIHTECWLEFGPVEYGYCSNYPDPKTGWDMETFKHNFHDWKLDCGGSNFDVALVRLAKLVRKHYGDYLDDTSAAIRKSQCGKPKCADCADLGRWMKKNGLSKKAHREDAKNPVSPRGEAK